MKLHNLYIADGQTVITHHRFADGLNLLEATDTNAVDGILRTLLGLPFQPTADGCGCIALATVQADEHYTIDYRQPFWWGDDWPIDLIVRDEQGGVCTEDYLALVQGTAPAVGDTAPASTFEQRLHRLLTDDTFVCFTAFCKEHRRHRLPTVHGDPHDTDIAFFASCRRAFIRKYAPVRLREDKPYLLRLTPDGQWIVVHEQTDEEVSLSETEAMLYHLRCFLLTIAFLDELRTAFGVHTVQKPLYISGLLERMDSMMDCLPFIATLQACPRQTILLMPRLINPDSM